MTNYDTPPAYSGSSDKFQEKGALAIFGNVGKQRATSESEHGGGPRYVYYRVYTPDGAIPLRTPADAGNPFIGRVKATTVPPPHNVLSLKRALSAAEGLADPDGSRTSIYAVCTDTHPAEPNAKVALLGLGLGETPGAAVGLVFHEELSNNEYEGRHSKDESERTYVPQYVYYRLHTQSGEAASVRAFDRSEPAVGRIDKMEIAPPNDVLSVRRCIARAEGQPIYRFGHLYGDPTETQPWADKTLLTDDGWDFPGSTATSPLLLVIPERRPGLLNRPLKVLEEQRKAHTAFWSSELMWLAAAPGDVVLTDGVPRIENHRALGAMVTGYMAVDAEGRRGLIMAGKKQINGTSLCEKLILPFRKDLPLSAGTTRFLDE
ncbi:hypothetical protein B0H15DRAFT_917920 [Mycena belliarum]|uniref:Uncharacterized protein n=1 Tax=Mycena belliarum TaxID=1033014 RepID=A0AAD6XLC7_9AGAR|nr:hypothetical protein B0H15DRAFT_917920 [Mycena belliae]